MSPSQSGVVAAHPSSGSPESPDHERAISRSPSPSTTATTKPEQRAQAREIVRLFQCQLCSRPIEEPISLPCGNSICKRCLPESHLRTNISYPGIPDRLRGVQCPFSDCAREHAIGDCELDVVLSKTASLVKDRIQQGRDEAAKTNVSTLVTVRDEWQVAGVPSLRPVTPPSNSFKGGRLVATWTMAEEGELPFHGEVTYDGIEPSPDSDFAQFELEALHQVQDVARTEMDCQICYALFFDPLTTSCGHTFCRSCLHRILDHSQYCPVCRRKLAMNPLLNRTSCPSNGRLTRIIETFWKDELDSRQEILAAEDLGRHQFFDVPLFVCTLSFPMVPTFLHIFEPRYRLMIRRALEGNRMFGMVLPKRSRFAGDPSFHELGTLLRIVNVQFYPDGRSLIETMGISRFRVMEHGIFDGYTMGKTNRIDDVSLEEEEATEAGEIAPPVAIEEETEDGEHKPAPPRPRDDTSFPSPETVDDLDKLSTKSLLDFALDFVASMRAQSVPWLTERMLGIYGECPTDPTIFPWWLASMLPVRDMEKYKLLGTSSVRERLKICCCWILEWETST